MTFDGAEVQGAPKGWDAELDGPVIGLPVLRDVDTQSGLPFMYSVWRPDADELALLMAGGAIRLGISGHTHPIVNLCTLKPEAVASSGCADLVDMSK